MSIAQPWGLLFFSLFIPVILFYLLKQRRRKVEVSSLFFWDKILKDEQTVTSLNRLKKWLSLLCQLLLISLLSLALARPTFYSRKGSVRAILVLDTSASMMTQEKGRSRFDLAREEARGIIRGLSIGDTLMLVAFHSHTEVLHPFSDNKKSLLAAVDQARVSHAVTEPRALTDLIEHLPADKRTTQVFLVTDGAFAPEPLKAGDNLQFSYIKIGDKKENVGITSFAVRSLPASPRDVQIHFEILNETDVERRIPTELKANGKLIDIFELAVPAHQAVSKTINQVLPEGGEIELLIDSPDNLILDNRAFAVLPKPKPVTVLLVTAENPFLEQALATDEDVELTKITPDKYDPTQPFTVRIFSGWCPADAPPGKSIFIGQWPASLQINRKTELKNPLITDWKREHPVNRHLALQNVIIQKASSLVGGAQDQVLLNSFEESLVLMQETPEHQRLVIGFDTAESDLPLRIAFPIMIGNAIRFMRSGPDSTTPPQPSIGVSLKSEEIFSLARQMTGIDSPTITNVIYPDGSPRSAKNLVAVETSGVYRVVTGKNTNALFAVNVAHPRESRIQGASEIPFKTDKPLKVVKSSFRLGFEPWVLLVLLAGLLCVAEWILFHRRIIE